MKLYIDATGVYVGTQTEAKRVGKGWKPVEVPVAKQGLIDYLNGLKAPSIPLTEEPVTIPLGPRPITNHTQRAVDIGEAFDKLTLSEQLHYAAMAMENARAKL